MKTSVRLYFAVLVTLSVAVSGCAVEPKPEVAGTAESSGSDLSKDSGTATPEKRQTIGFSALTLTNPFFKIIADTMAEDRKSVV